MSENVNHPNHYNTGKFEVIDVIEDWNLGFNLGNAIKYIGRADHKARKEEDLKKAIWYIERELGLHKKTCLYYTDDNKSKYCLNCKHGDEDDGALYCIVKGNGVFEMQN